MNYKLFSIILHFVTIMIKIFALQKDEASNDRDGSHSNPNIPGKKPNLFKNLLLFVSCNSNMQFSRRGFLGCLTCAHSIRKLIKLKCLTKAF